MTLDNILDEIKKAETIVILTHDLPDGDAVGSSLALMFALKSIGKNPDVIIPEYSNCFKFLPGTSEIKTESDIEKYDLAIALDCADGKNHRACANGQAAGDSGRRRCSLRGARVYDRQRHRLVVRARGRHLCSHYRLQDRRRDAQHS